MATNTLKLPEGFVLEEESRRATRRGEVKPPEGFVLEEQIESAEVGRVGGLGMPQTVIAGSQDLMSILPDEGRLLADEIFSMTTDPNAVKTDLINTSYWSNKLEMRFEDAFDLKETIGRQLFGIEDISRDQILQGIRKMEIERYRPPAFEAAEEPGLFSRMWHAIRSRVVTPRDIEGKIARGPFMALLLGKEEFPDLEQLHRKSFKQAVKDAYTQSGLRMVKSLGGRTQLLGDIGTKLDNLLGIDTLESQQLNKDLTEWGEYMAMAVDHWWADNPEEQLQIQPGTGFIGTTAQYILHPENILQGALETVPMLMTAALGHITGTTVAKKVGFGAKFLPWAGRVAGIAEPEIGEEYTSARAQGLDVDNALAQSYTKAYTRAVIEEWTLGEKIKIFKGQFGKAASHGLAKKTSDLLLGGKRAYIRGAAEEGAQSVTDRFWEMVFSDSEGWFEGGTAGLLNRLTEGASEAAAVGGLLEMGMAGAFSVSGKIVAQAGRVDVKEQIKRINQIRDDIKRNETLNKQSKAEIETVLDEKIEQIEEQIPITEPTEAKPEAVAVAPVAERPAEGIEAPPEAAEAVREEKEHIVSAAIKVGKKVFTGNSHVEIIREIVKSGELPERFFTEGLLKRKDIDLFLTNKGRLVNLEEAKGLKYVGKVTPPEVTRAELELDLADLTYKELQKQAKELGIKANQRKDALVEQIAEAQVTEPAVEAVAEGKIEDEVGIWQLSRNEFLKKHPESLTKQPWDMEWVEQEKIFVQGKLQQSQEYKNLLANTIEARKAVDENTIKSKQRQLDLIAKKANRAFLEFDQKADSEITKLIIEVKKGDKDSLVKLQEYAPDLARPAPAAKETWTSEDAEFATRDYYRTKKGKTIEQPASISDGKVLELADLLELDPETLISAKQYSGRKGGVSRKNMKVKNIILPITRPAPAVPEVTITEIDAAKKEGKRLISKDAFEAAKKRLSDPTTLRAGIDPQSLIDLATVGAFHIESGLRSFADWSAQMIKDFGEKVQPHLQAVWDNIHKKPAVIAELELKPRPGELKDEFRARVRAAKGIKVRPVPKKPAELPPSKPTKAEQQVIDAKKFNQQIKEHQEAVKSEAGIIDTESVDNIREPFGREMTPEWYEANTKVYKKTILQKSSEFIKNRFKELDFLLGTTSTRLHNISPELFRRLRRHEFNVMTRTTEQMKRIEPLVKAAKKLRSKNPKEFRALDIAYKNSEGKIVREIAERNGILKEVIGWEKLRDELYHAGNAVGLGIDYRREYMHRSIKDSKGLLEFMRGTDDWSIIRKVIEDKESQRGRVMTETERAAVVNTLLRGYRTSALTLTAPGAAKARAIDEITPEINQFYHPFTTSMQNYIETMNEKIAAREFFGRQSKEITKLRAQQSALRTRLAKLSTRQGRQKAEDIAKEIRIGFLTATLPDHISKAKEKFAEITEKLERMGADDLSDTIGQYVIELVTNDEIKPSQEKEVRDLLMGRFDPKGTSGLIGEIIPLTYIDVLSQFTNSITQLEELALAFYRSPVGFIPAAIKAIINLNEVPLQDIGLTTISQEITDVDSRKILAMQLSITQFRRFDMFAKQVLVNVALEDMRKGAIKEGMTFNDRIRRVFGEETNQVVKDLKNRVITGDVKFLLCSQILDVQPIAKSEMPEAYNRAGNLRIFYQLKTFTIKQFDFVRTEALQDMRNPKADPTRFMRGFGRLMWLSFSLALFGAGRDLLVDFITGRPFDLSDSVIDTFLRRFFFSRFQYSKAMREGIGTAFLEGFVPATKTIDAITKDIGKVSRDDTDGLDIWRSVPIAGEMYFWWFGRGREKALKEQRKARRDAVRRKPLFTGTKN